MKRQVLKGRLVILLGVAGVVCAGTVFAHEIQFRRQANLLAHQAEDLVNQGNKAAALQVFQQYINFRPKDGLVMNRYVEVLEESITPTEKNLRPKDRDQRLLIDSLERLLLLDDAPRYDKRKKLIGLLMTYRFYSNASMHLKLLKDDPESKLQDDAWLWEELAKCELGESKYQNLDQACEYLRSAVACKSKPARPETYAYLATILRKDVNTKPAKDEADRMIEELILLNPDDPKARLIRAEYLLAIPEKDANQNQTLSKDVDFLRKSAVGADANILYAVAKMELDGGKLEQARTFLTAGAKSFPDQQRFHLVLATVLLKLGETEQAKTELKTLVGQLPPTDRYYFAALDELVDLGETALVTTAIPKLDATESTRPYADYLRGRLAIKTGDWAVALGLAEASYSAIERTAGFEGRGHLLIARCQDLAGNPDAQLASATAALRANRTLVPAKLLQANAREKLGQFGPAAEIYREILTIDPAVKPLLAKVLLNEQLYRDPSTRSWRELEELLKDKSPTPDLVVLQALMLVKQNRPDEAMRAVEAAVAKDAKQPQLQVALAHLRASHVNPQAGLTTLEEAEKLIGDTVEFRLARANILTRDPATSDTPRIAALSEKADAFAARDRYRLWSSLGETFIALNRPPEAERLYRKAADLIPTDLPSRLALYDIAINTKQYPKASAIATEVQGIEGQTGPHATVLRTFVEMKTLDPKQKSRLIELRRQVEAARSKKSGWSSLYACLGDLNRMLDNEDAALENYIRAIDLGDRNPALVRVAYQMLMSRRQFEQANAVVARAGRTSATENVRWGSAWGLSTSDPKAAMSLLDPNSKVPDDHVLRAKLLVLSGNPNEAEASFRTALSLSQGKGPEIWVDFVRFLASAGKINEAKKAYREAETTLTPLATGAAKGIVASALGRCHEALGEFREAEELYRAAIAAGGESHIAVRQLAGLYQRLNRRAEAETLLDASIKTATTDGARRQLRRQLAISKVSHAQGYRSMPEAAALIEQNISEAGQIEDIRAKALILAVDATKAGQAKELLLETAKKFPLTAEENVLLARLCLDENDSNQAETYLISATRTPNVVPEHLGLLARVQTRLDKPVQAKATVEKLKLLSPTSWDATAEEARLLAKAGDKSGAVKKMLQHPYAADPLMTARTVAPFLEEIGCYEDAEKQFERVLNETSAPNRHTFLAGFYLRHGKLNQAIELALSFAQKPDVPVDLSCRILSGAVHSRPTNLKDADGSWKKKVDEVRTFIQAQVEKSPNNPGVRQAEAELADAEGRYDDEIASYEAALAKQPDNLMNLNNLAFIMAVHAKEKTNRPLELIEQVIQNYGPTATSLDTRGVVHTAAGRYADAIRDLKLAVQLSQNPTYRFHLAVAYEGAGDSRGREDALRVALNEKLTREMLHPKEWPAYDRLTAPPPKKR